MSSPEPNQLWTRYREHCYIEPGLGFSLDTSRVRFDDGYLARMAPAAASAMDAMAALEGGGTANPDEGRMVGHYWLRAPDLAPTGGLADSIRGAVASVQAFAGQVHHGVVQGTAGPFRHLVHVGIGGSALGAQLLCGALSSGRDKLTVHFLDNADPDGIDQLVGRLCGSLGQTLVSVVSKSGRTPTPWQVMLELEAVYRSSGLDFARHAAATTTAGSALDARAAGHGWLARFPVWEWVGGRTSVTSAVGLLPAALQGADTAAFLDGAAAMDRLTRSRDPRCNPALLLALMWYWLGDGRGARRMVVLPYKDRLALLPRYIQQLVMESVGKELDRAGRVVHQGLTVYGNKGSSDQHSYVQQLRDGPADFFVTFVHVTEDRDGPSPAVAPGLTLGDHLFGHLEGTRDALYERGRDSVTITVPDVSAASLGMVVALHERAVGLYAELLDVNAYHQPGVDKQACAPTVELQLQAVGHLDRTGVPSTAEEIAAAIGRPERAETIYKVLRRLASDRYRPVAAAPAPRPFEERFSTRRPGPPEDAP